MRILLHIYELSRGARGGSNIVPLMEPAPAPPAPGPPPWFWIAGAATLAHALILALGLPLFSALPGWFWPLAAKELRWPWLLALAGAAALLARAAWTARRTAARLAALLALGYALQLGFALAEGRGLAGLRDRMVVSGHARFVEMAIERQGLVETVRDYEDLVYEGALGRFAPSKPPGQLLLYMLWERAGSWFAGDAPPQVRAARMRDQATVLWPLFAAAAVVPLYFLGRRLVDERGATAAALLYAFVPAFGLVTLHTDQVFFPLFFTATLLVGVVAAARASPALGLATGVAAYLAAFCTFPLALALPVAVAVSFDRVRRRALAATWGAALAGFLATDLVFRLQLGYDIVERYRTATMYHAWWKGWRPGLGETLKYGAVNLLEYVLWLGLPLALAVAARAARADRDLRRGSWSGATPLTVALLGALVVLLALGQTKGEVARLWLFLVPGFCLVAADELRAGRLVRWRGTLPWLLALQFATTLATKAFQDFW